VLLTGVVLAVGEIILFVAFNRVLLPGGLFLLIILGYLFAWEDIKS
jgi:hypothetical protein